VLSFHSHAHDVAPPSPSRLPAPPNPRDNSSRAALATPVVRAVAIVGPLSVSPSLSPPLLLFPGDGPPPTSPSTTPCGPAIPITRSTRKAEEEAFPQGLQ
jgi:hypothetical protein